MYRERAAEQERERIRIGHTHRMRRALRTWTQTDTKGERDGKRQKETLREREREKGPRCLENERVISTEAHRKSRSGEVGRKRACTCAEAQREKRKNVEVFCLYTRKRERALPAGAAIE